MRDNNAPRYLVFSSVGKNSRHKRFWLRDSERRFFDLCLYNYTAERGLFAKDADIYVERSGSKFDNLAHLAETQPELISRYDALLAIDDDMEIDTAGLNELFRIFMEYKLDLAQPGFTWRSLISHPITRAKYCPGLVLRYTNFVENNITVFSRSSFQKCVPTFRASKSGFGLDLIWPKLLGYPTLKIAVIDRVRVRHPRRRRATSELDKILPRPAHKREGLELARSWGVDVSAWQRLFKEYGIVGQGRQCRKLERHISKSDFYRGNWLCRLLAWREKIRYVLIKRARWFYGQSPG